MRCCRWRRGSRFLQIRHAFVLHFQQRLQILDLFFQLGHAIVGFLDRLVASDDLFLQCMNTRSRLAITGTGGRGSSRGGLVPRQLQYFLRLSAGGGRLSVGSRAYLARNSLLGWLLRWNRRLPCRSRQLFLVGTPIARLDFDFLAGVGFGNASELVGRRQLENFAGLQPVHVLAGESVRVVPDQQHQHLFETDVRGLGRTRNLAERIAALDGAISICTGRSRCGTRQCAALVEEGRLGTADGFHRRCWCWRWLRVHLGWWLGRRLRCSSGSRLFGFRCPGLGLRRLCGRFGNRFRLGL